MANEDGSTTENAACPDLALRTALLEELDAAVGRLLDAAAASPSPDTLVDDTWTVRDVVGHVTFWHESFARNVDDLVHERRPAPLRGRLSDLNTRGVAEASAMTMEMVVVRLRAAHATIAASILSPTLGLIPYRVGSRAYAPSEHLQVVRNHIRTHATHLERALQPGRRPGRRRRQPASEGWTAMMGADPSPWLIASEEPSARWLALTGLLDRTPNDPDARDARAAVVADAGTRELVGRLGDWETPAVLSGHESPAFGPNLLGLLWRMGVREGDHPAIDASLDAMLRHQDEHRRFATCAISRANPEGAWGSLLCDTHAISEVLVRFGRAEAPAVRAAVARMGADVAGSADGPAWPCIPNLGFRGPGRKGDACPQVSVEALRTLALLPPDRRPAVAVDVARTLLALWRRRGDAKPYMFGHGVSFKTVKWPPLWYSVLAVLDALGGYPELWRGPGARSDDRRSLAELAACLVAYNVDADGRVTPRSCYRGFDAFSFGQKRLPSPFATALVATVLRRFDDLADEVAAVDILALGSSKGRSGTVRPPKRPFVPGGARGA